MMLLSSRLSLLALLRLGAASDTLGLSFFELGSVVANNLGGVPSPLAVPTADHRDSLPPPTTSATHSLAPATSCFFPRRLPGMGPITSDPEEIRYMNIIANQTDGARWTPQQSP